MKKFIVDAYNPITFERRDFETNVNEDIVKAVKAALESL
jgi:hypothetical protein